MVDAKVRMVKAIVCPKIWLGACPWISTNLPIENPMSEIMIKLVEQTMIRLLTPREKRLSLTPIGAWLIMSLSAFSRESPNPGIPSARTLIYSS